MPLTATGLSPSPRPFFSPPAQMDNFTETLAQGGVYYDADVTGLPTADALRRAAITTVRD